MAKDENNNPFYQTTKCKESSDFYRRRIRKHVKLRDTFLYDIETKSGEEYAFTSE